MNCTAFREQLSAWADGELAAEREASLTSHVEDCRECQTALEEFQQFQGAFRAARMERVTQADLLADRVIEILGAGTTSPSLSKSGFPVWKTALIWLSGVAAGLAIALLLFKGDRSIEQPVAQQPIDSKTLDGSPEPPAQGADANTVPVAWINDFIGEVQVDGSVLETTPGLISFACPSDSVIHTGDDARCEVKLADGSVVRLNDKTNVVIRSKNNVEFREGQLFCNSSDDADLKVLVRKQSVQSESPLHASMSCSPSGTLWAIAGPQGMRVTSAEGDVQVELGASKVSLKGGQTAQIVDEAILPVSQYGDDPLLGTRWIHPLLRRKDLNDPEVNERVNAMLAKVGQTKLSTLYEAEIRSLGEHCVLPLLRYLASPRAASNPVQRKRAARIVSDLATSWTIGDLIGLLESDDSGVRVAMAKALERITGLNQGVNEKTWHEAKQPQSVEQWKSWWKQNRVIYPSLKDSLQQKKESI